MTNPLIFDDLQEIFHRHIDLLPDSRKKGPNTRYRIQHGALGAFGIFLTQSPSFVDCQRTLQHTRGQNNAHTLLDVEQIPCDTQIRKRLDPIAPNARDPVCVEVFERLEQHRMLVPFRTLGDQLLVALDGTNSFASNVMHCHNCLTRQLRNGQTLSYHAALPPVIVCPGQSQVIALPPEDIMPQDGHATQDCARAAGTRWLATHAEPVAPHGVTCLGDDLSSKPPLCAVVFHHRGTCIFPWKPDSHPTLSERGALWPANDAMAVHEGQHWHGRCTAVTMVRSINDVLLRSGDDPLAGNGFAITVVNAKTGEQLSHHSCITNHRLTADNVVAVAQSGRGRWKIDNANTNVLKTKGSHLEHNFGHGKQYLAACMLSLNLLAFPFHTVLEWSDDRYALLRRVLARRQTFCNDIQAVMRSMVFDHWDHLMDCMIRGLELESQCDSS